MQCNEPLQMANMGCALTGFVERRNKWKFVPVLCLVLLPTVLLQTISCRFADYGLSRKPWGSVIIIINIMIIIVKTTDRRTSSSPPMAVPWLIAGWFYFYRELEVLL